MTFDRHELKSLFSSGSGLYSRELYKVFWTFKTLSQAHKTREKCQTSLISKQKIFNFIEIWEYWKKKSCPIAAQNISRGAGAPGASLDKILIHDFISYRYWRYYQLSSNLKSFTISNLVVDLHFLECQNIEISDFFHKAVTAAPC